MQHLLSVLNVQAGNLNLSCNVNKTVCILFNPNKRDRIITSSFPASQSVTLVLNLLISSSI